MHSAACLLGSSSPRLPHEILEQIFLYNLRHDEWRADVRAHENFKGWKAEARSLATYCLVSGDWYYVANYLLYGRRIDIRTMKTARLLRRTIEELAVRQIACPIRWLSICNYPILRLDTSPQDINAHIGPLLSLCTELQYLELRFVTPDSTEALPVFAHLRELSVADMDFCDIAPIISRSPELTRLDAFMLGNPLFPSSRAALDPPRELASPTCPLDRVTLADCKLPLTHARWLLGGRPIAHLEVQADRFGMLAPLSRAAGPAIRSLRLTGFVPQKRDGLARALARFTHLEALRVDYTDCPWPEVLRALPASLRSLTLPGVSAVTRTLCGAFWDANWLPTLENVVIHKPLSTGPVCDGEGVAQEDKVALEKVCLGRVVRCIFQA